MPSLLRPRLTCFYCGSKSAQKRTSHIRQWTCEKCEAINYLDEHGEITDPPAFQTPDPIRFAQSLPRSASPVNIPTSSETTTLFCSTCLKNQHLVTQALAAYLPPPNDSRYESFEESYPEYRRSLEERYPQVCADCAPTVEARIRAAGYAAKTDHLRRMMERTRAGDIRQNTGPGQTWKGFVVGLAGIVWWSSIMIQIVWHLLGALEGSGQEEDRELREGLLASIPAGLSCIVQTLQTWRIDRSCVACTADLVGVTIWLGLAVAWWNNKLARRLRARQSRLVGWGDHVKLQMVLLGTRTIAWWWLKDQELANLSPMLYRAAHAYLAFFILLATIISTRLVKLDTTPRVSFHDDTEPLAARAPRTQSDAQGNRVDFQALTDTAAFARQSPSYVPPFPIAKLAPLQTTQSQTPSRFNPPTPPPDDEADLMDWTPSQEAKLRFNPAAPRSLALATPLAKEPSPFHGRLPNAPLAPAHQLRNPPNKPLFRKATEAQQKTFFEQMTRRDEANGAGHRFDDDDDDSPRKDKVDMAIAPPKLFMKDDTLDTGLAAMFDSVFSIKDEPKEVRIAEQQKESHRQEPYDSSTLLALGACLVPIAVGMFVVWLKALP